MTSILWEKLGLQTPPEADLEPHDGDVPHDEQAWTQQVLLDMATKLPAV